METSRRRDGLASGFTLVELLVVIGVLTILVGLLMPAIQNATARAKETNCIANLSQIGKAIFAYSGNYRSFFPAPAYADTATSVDQFYDGDAPHSYTWKGKIIGYVGTTGDTDDERYQVYKCPSVRRFYDHKSFYGVNAYLTMYTALPDPDPDDPNTDVTEEQVVQGGRRKYLHFDKIENHANTFLLGENDTGHWAVRPQIPRSSDDFTDLTKDAECYARHRGRSVWLFADGESRSMTPVEAGERYCYYWFDIKSKARP